MGRQGDISLIYKIHIGLLEYSSFADGGRVCYSICRSEQFSLEINDDFCLVFRCFALLFVLYRDHLFCQNNRTDFWTIYFRYQGYVFSEWQKRTNTYLWRQWKTKTRRTLDSRFLWDISKVTMHFFSFLLRFWSSKIEINR